MAKICKLQILQGGGMGTYFSKGSKRVVFGSRCPPSPTASLIPPPLSLGSYQNVLIVTALTLMRTSMINKLLCIKTMVFNFCCDIFIYDLCWCMLKIKDFYVHKQLVQDNIWHRSFKQVMWVILESLKYLTLLTINNSFGSIYL